MKTMHSRRHWNTCHDSCNTQRGPSEICVCYKNPCECDPCGEPVCKPKKKLVIDRCCNDPCDDSKKPEPPAPSILWDIDAEGWPTGSVGYRLCCFVSAAGVLQPATKPDGSPVDRFTYRSGIKDFGSVYEGEVDIDLLINAASYKQYIRTGNSQAEILSAPFKFYTGQTISARYIQYHLEVQS